MEALTAESMGTRLREAACDCSRMRFTMAPTTERLTLPPQAF